MHDIFSLRHVPALCYFSVVDITSLLLMMSNYFGLINKLINHADLKEGTQNQAVVKRLSFFPFSRIHLLVFGEFSCFVIGGCWGGPASGRGLGVAFRSGAGNPPKLAQNTENTPLKHCF